MNILARGTHHSYVLYTLQESHHASSKEISKPFALIIHPKPKQD